MFNQFNSQQTQNTGNFMMNQQSQPQQQQNNTNFMMNRQQQPNTGNFMMNQQPQQQNTGNFMMNQQPQQQQQQNNSNFMMNRQQQQNNSNFMMNQQPQAQQQQNSGNFMMNQQQQQNSGNSMMNQYNNNQQLQQQLKTMEQMNNLNEIKNIMIKIQNFQTQPHLAQLIQILKVQQSNAILEIQKATNQNDIQISDIKQIQTTNNRLINIKNKNEQLIKKLLAVKGKLQKLLYANITLNPQLQIQNNQVMDKIKYLKSQITQKCAHLKTLKINKKHQKYDKIPKTQSYLQMGSSLTQLKKGTQCLDRQVLMIKQQIDLVRKYLNQRKF